MVKYSAGTCPWGELVPTIADRYQLAPCHKPQSKKTTSRFRPGEQGDNLYLGVSRIWERLDRQVLEGEQATGQQHSGQNEGCDTVGEGEIQQALEHVTRGYARGVPLCNCLVLLADSAISRFGEGAVG